MATIGQTYLTQLDILRQSDEGQAIAEVVEVLMQHNPMMADAVVVECNKGTFHRHLIRTGLPSVAWGRLYKGTPQSKSNYTQVDDTTGFIEGRSAVDKRLLALNPKTAPQVRLNEADGQLEAMAQKFATSFFYDDVATNPDGVKGLAARYSVSGTSGAANQVIKAGGAGSDNTSVWFTSWGNQFTSVLHPEGMTSGVQREDKGEQRVLDGSSDPYYVLEELFTHHFGISVANWLGNSRICNVDLSDIRAGTVDLYKFMRQAYYKTRMDSRRRAGGGDSGVEPVRTAIYCNADVLEALDALGTNSGASDNFTRLKPMELEGAEVMTYRGIPIRVCEAITNAETLVA
jgi:hypothetical protein